MGNVICAVGYVRASTDDQPNSPAVQTGALIAWAARCGAQLVETFSDVGISGAAPLDERPGLLAALEVVAGLGKGAVLIVARRDRLARDVIVAAMVERLAARTGGKVESADGTGIGDGPEAQLMRHIVDAVAQYERAVIGLRIRAALAHLRSRGVRMGGAALGWRYTDHTDESGHCLVEPVEGERASVERIMALRSNGLSVRAIAAALREERLPTKSGGRWHHTTVQRVIKRAIASRPIQHS